MKISLSNVAKVEKAEIELDGITIVAGLNGSGKTTVSKAIYASINAYNRLPKRIMNARIDSIFHNVVDILNRNLDLSYQMRQYELVHDFLTALPIDRLIEEVNSGESDTLYDFISTWFKSKRNLKKKDIRDIQRSVESVLLRTEENYTRFLADSVFQRVFSSQINYFGSKSETDIKFDFFQTKLESRFVNNELIKNTIGVDYDRKAIYIESTNVLDLYNPSQIRFSVSGVSTAATEDLFECLRSNSATTPIYEDYKNSKELLQIIDHIFRNVTHGRLDIGQKGDIEFFDSVTKHPVKISNLSAGLKIFILLQSLLEKRQLSRGDILIIDEPEVNLHPEWQVKFAEILVLLQKELGLIVYVNTHSPYFARAIEVKLAEYKIADKGKFYLLKENEERRCICSDVSRNTEEIYTMLYKPLEKL